MSDPFSESKGNKAPFFSPFTDLNNFLFFPQNQFLLKYSYLFGSESFLLIFVMEFRDRFITVIERQDEAAVCSLVMDEVGWGGRKRITPQRTSQGTINGNLSLVIRGL